MIAPKKLHYRNLRARQQLMFSKLYSLVSNINFKLYIKYIQNSMLNKATPFSIGIIAIVACTSSLCCAIIMPDIEKRPQHWALPQEGQYQEDILRGGGKLERRGRIKSKQERTWCCRR
jgi:hypothetical protein